MCIFVIISCSRYHFSLFGFIYGTFPAAPGVLAFALDYGVMVRQTVAALVLCKLTECRSNPLAAIPTPACQQSNNLIHNLRSSKLTPPLFFQRRLDWFMLLLCNNSRISVVRYLKTHPWRLCIEPGTILSAPLMFITAKMATITITVTSTRAIQAVVEDTGQALK